MVLFACASNVAKSATGFEAGVACRPSLSDEPVGLEVDMRRDLVSEVFCAPALPELRQLAHPRLW
jgi:hypothetical protein